METPKLVTVTRTDIPEGYQAVQSTHAAIDFVFEHPTRAGPWHKESNTLVMLTVKDTKALIHLMRKCDYLSLAYTVFREPDIGNQITAICMEPHPEVYKMVAKLPLLIPKIESNEQEHIGNQSTISQQNENTSIPEREGETSPITVNENINV
jgi:peptidyl-tRNA hydrolase